MSQVRQQSGATNSTKMARRGNNVRRWKTTDIIRALRAAHGKVYLAARKLGCHPGTIYGRAKECKAVRDTIRECRAFVLDTAEDKLFAAVKRGNVDAIKFLLKTKGKRRGYVERREYAGPDGGPIPTKDANAPDWSKLTVEELRAIRDLHQQLQERAAAGPGDHGAPADGEVPA
jgi:hypothetical protein